MKTIIFTLLILLFNSMSYAEDLKICKNEKNRTYGICSGKNIIEKQEYNRLNFDKESKIYYGYKSLGISNVNDEAYISYGFDKNGKKIFETPGLIGDFENGIADIKYNYGFRFLGSGPKEISTDEKILNKFQNYLFVDKAIFNSILIINKLFMIEKPIYKDELMKMEEKVKVGYINTKGEIVIKPIYKNDYIINNFKGDFNYGIVNIEENKYGIVNKVGETIIPLEYNEIYKMNGKVIIYKESCGFFICNGIRTELDKKTLKENSKNEIKRYKHELVNYITKSKLDTDKRTLGLLIMLAFILSTFLIPFTVIYQKYKKEERINKSIQKGIFWAFIIGFTSVIGTIIALFALVLVFFGANMLTVVVSQDDK